MLGAEEKGAGLDWLNHFDHGIDDELFAFMGEASPEVHS